MSRYAILKTCLCLLIAFLSGYIVYIEHKYTMSQIELAELRLELTMQAQKEVLTHTKSVMKAVEERDKERYKIDNAKKSTNKVIQNEKKADVLDTTLPISVSNALCLQQQNSFSQDTTP